MDGHAEDEEVGNDIGDGVANERAAQVDTVARQRGIPRLGHGHALEDADAADGNPPHHRDGEDDCRHDLKAAREEEPAVHTEDAALDDHDGGHVHAFERHLQLRGCQRLVIFVSGVRREGGCRHGIP